MNSQAKAKGRGLGNKADSDRFGLEGSRREAHAGFMAEQAAWDASNAYAQNNSAFASAIGLGAGYLDPGQAPTNLQGMAREGALGEEAQKASRSSDEGGRLFQTIAANKREAGDAANDVTSHNFNAGTTLSLGNMKDMATQGGDFAKEFENIQYSPFAQSVFGRVG